MVRLRAPLHRKATCHGHTRHRHNRDRSTPFILSHPALGLPRLPLLLHPVDPPLRFRVRHYRIQQVLRHRLFLLDRFRVDPVLCGGVWLSQRTHLRMYLVGRHIQVLNIFHEGHPRTGIGRNGNAMTGNGLRQRGREGEPGAMDGGDNVLPNCFCVYYSTAVI